MCACTEYGLREIVHHITQNCSPSWRVQEVKSLKQHCLPGVVVHLFRNYEKKVVRLEWTIPQSNKALLNSCLSVIETRKRKAYALPDINQK